MPHEVSYDSQRRLLECSCGYQLYATSAESAESAAIRHLNPGLRYETLRFR